MDKSDFRMFYLDWQKDAEGCKDILRQAYRRMEDEHTARITFYDGTVQDAEGFACDLCRPGSLPYILYLEGKPAGVTWLNSVEGKSARGHVVFFKCAWGRRRSWQIGRWTYENFLSFKDASGYLFEVIIGLTPKGNPLAWKGAIASGAVMVGTIPHGAWLHYEGKCEDAILTVATRESLGLVEANQ